MTSCLLSGSEDTGALNDVFGLIIVPGDGIGIPLAVHRYLLVVDDKLTTVRTDVSFELAMGGVILEYVGHVVQTDEGIVNGNDGHALVDGDPQDEASNSTKSIDSDLGHGYGLTVWLRLMGTYV